MSAFYIPSTIYALLVHRSVSASIPSSKLTQRPLNYPQAPTLTPLGACHSRHRRPLGAPLFLLHHPHLYTDPHTARRNQQHCFSWFHRPLLRPNPHPKNLHLRRPPAHRNKTRPPLLRTSRSLPRYKRQSSQRKQREHPPPSHRLQHNHRQSPRPVIFKRRPLHAHRIRQAPETRPRPPTPLPPPPPPKPLGPQPRRPRPRPPASHRRKRLPSRDRRPATPIPPYRQDPPRPRRRGVLASLLLL